MSFVIERYLTARRIYKQRDEKAHDGFPATANRAAVPAQSWSQWFAWAYGMELEEYVKLAQAGNHAALVAKLPYVLVQYQIEGRWHDCICAAGESYEDCAASLRRNFRQVTDVRPRA